MQLCGCVSFSVMAGNSYQNENTFLQKSYWVTFLRSASWCLFFIRPNTLLLCISLFCIFLLYRTDPQVEVHIRIYYYDKYEIVYSGNPCLSGGCAIVITTRKKSSSRLSGGYAIVITTGKKNSSRLSGGCAITTINVSNLNVTNLY